MFISIGDLWKYAQYSEQNFLSFITKYFWFENFVQESIIIATDLSKSFRFIDYFFGR
jgi:hypothetical protein